MARRNKSSQQSAMDRLRRSLTEHFDVFGDDDDFDDFLENETGGLPTMPEGWLREWKGVLEAFSDQHSPTTKLKRKFVNPKIQVRFFNSQGEVKATATVKKSHSSRAGKFRLHLTFNVATRDFHCSCNCKLKSLCEHTYGLIVYLQEAIEDPQSKIYKEIMGEDGLERQRRLQQQRFSSLVANAAGDSRETRFISIEEDQVELAERICWNMNEYRDNYGESHLEVFPILQKETKRGGWTKGKEVKVNTFLKLPKRKLSSIDQRITEEAIQEARYYYQESTLVYADVFRILAGSDVFYFNKKPARMVIVDLEFVVLEEKNGYRLSSNAYEFKKARLQPEKIFSFGGGFILVDDVDQTAIQIVIMYGTESAIELCQHLERDPIIFAKDEKKELLNQLKPLQSVYSIRFPKGLIDEERPEELDLTLVLRMQKTGALEATVCYRKSDDTLTLPGEGLGRETRKEKKKTIQFVRDLDAEREEANSLTQQLKLDRQLEVSERKYRLENQDEIFELLTQVGELVGKEEIKVVWHKASIKQFNVLGSLSAKNVQIRVARKRDWFGLEGSCTIGNQEIPLKDLLEGIRSNSMNGLLEVQPGQWAQVTEELRKTLQKLADVSTVSRGVLKLDESAAMTVAALEDASIQLEADKAWQKTLKRVRNVQDFNPDPPAALDCDLRDYQVDGFRWMCRLAEWGVGGILADDMGLGKTVQALAVLLQRVETGPALVIAPTSLGFNWEQECERFAPSLNPILFRESDREALIKNVSESDVVICSYGLALREADLLKSKKWGTLVLDEAQNIKNSNSKTAKQIRQFKADWKVALTGTPMENHLGELWSLFQSVSPGVLGGWEQFRKRFALPIEKHQDDERRVALAQVISPFILRREKREVLKDLPDRNETNLFVELSTEERKRYDQMRLSAIAELDDLGGDEFSQDQRFRVLQILTRLRQLSCHIGLVDKTWEGSSAKLEVLMERLDQLKEEGHRPLIFSQFTSHLALIRAACDAKGISYQYLDGQTTPKKRQEYVEKFQAGEGDAFLISLKAGGTGLNLTAADYVIHMDPWWNPAVEDQATDRAHRIGQTKNVMVYRIIAKGTIEEQILKLHEEKRGLVEGILAGSASAGRLSSVELANLIRSEDQRLLVSTKKK